MPSIVRLDGMIRCSMNAVLPVLLRLVIAAISIVPLFPSDALAQNLPNGAILQVDNGTGPTSNAYPTANVFENYSVEFTPGSSGANYVLFAFRQVPAFWTFGNVSLTANGSTVNLFTDPTFTHGGAVSGQSGLTAPADWGIVYQSTTTPGAAGRYAPPGSSYANSEPGVNQGTAGSWYDGSIETYDGIYQGVDLTAGTEYDISFALSGNNPAVSPTIEMGVFAGACVTLSADPGDCVPNNPGFAVDLTPGQTVNAGGTPINATYDAAGLAAIPPTLIPEFDGGTLVLDGTSLTPFNFTITGLNGTVDLAGLSALITSPITDALTGTPGGLAVIDSGIGGALTLAGVNTYTGATSTAAGATLALSGSGSIATSSDLIDNGVFDISALTDGGAAITSLDGSGSVVLGGNNLALTAAAGTFDGVIGGSGQFDLNGGTEILNGVNTYTGGTFVNAGTLIDGDSNHSGAVIGGPADVLFGATLEGYGTVAGSLTNSGSVIPGGGAGAPGTLTVQGDYTQASSGGLLIAVTPTASSVIAASGNVSLSGGVTFAYAPGTYSPHTYSFITTPGGITGTFSTIGEEGSVPTALTRSVVYDTAATPDPVNLVLAAKSVTPPPPVVITPADSGIFSAQSQALAAATQQTTNALLSQAGSPGGNDAACEAEEGVAQQAAGSPNTSSTGNIAKAFASAFCRAGGWLRATGNLLNVSNQTASQNYRANTGGILGGADTAIGPTGLRIGIAVGYSETSLRDTVSGSGNADTTSVGIYGSEPAGAVLIAAAVSYSHSDDKTNRQTGIGGAYESHGSNIYAGGVQASLPLTLETFAVTPAAGVRFAGVDAGSFKEIAPLAAFAVSGASLNYLSIQPYVTVAVAKCYTTSSGVAISPDVSIGYEGEADNLSRRLFLTGADGTNFNSSAPFLDASDALLSAGIVAGYRNWSLFGRYSAQVARNWTNQIGQLGLEYNF